MPLQQALADFTSKVAQCNNLIANAHRMGTDGQPILPVDDQKQITVAAFLNQFIAWETFLEATITELMIGAATLSGRAPVRYVMPPDLAAAHQMIKATKPFFDYANHEFVKLTVRHYFENGYPFEPHLSAIQADLIDLKTMRNGSAHVARSTQTAIDSLAMRIFGSPKVGITLYHMLTAVDPRSAAGETIFSAYQNKLTATAGLIVQG